MRQDGLIWRGRMSSTRWSLSHYDCGPAWSFWQKVTEPGKVKGTTVQLALLLLLLHFCCSSAMMVAVLSCIHRHSFSPSSVRKLQHLKTWIPERAWRIPLFTISSLSPLSNSALRISAASPPLSLPRSAIHLTQGNHHHRHWNQQVCCCNCIQICTSRLW